MKALLAILLSLLMLSGCMAQPQPETTIPPAQTDPLPDPTLEALTAYEKVAESFVLDHVAADGQQIWFDTAFGFIEENSFAIADVDGDGSEELVLIMSTAPMAGMCEWVYGYDSASGTVKEKLSVFPDVTFYTGGYLEAGWSHNQGLAGEALWPYTLMQYNKAEGAYQVIAHVDAWDRSISETDFEGHPFPAEADTEGTGIVFLITQATDSGEFVTDSVSRPVYEAWRNGFLAQQTVIQPEFLKTTLDNARAISPEA